MVISCFGTFVLRETHISPSIISSKTRTSVVNITELYGGTKCLETSQEGWTKIKNPRSRLLCHRLLSDESQ